MTIDKIKIANGKHNKSGITKKMWSDDNYRRKVCESNKKQANSASGKVQRSKQAIKAWESDNYRTDISTKSKMNYDFEFTDDIKNKLSVSTKALWQTPLKERYLYGLKKGHAVASTINVSSLEKDIKHRLEDMGVEHILHHRIGPYEFDFFIPERNVLIEVQGDYWHSLPINQLRDRCKYSYIKNNFPDVKLSYIWEYEFKDSNNIARKLNDIVGV